ncbi:uncharacterized protein [Euwallacea fornicatus]|uniref:uncharacterized protein n=1 Tax=Euwallacea fornicatus TaxID=995702 RepID=UPI00338E6FA3
MMSTLPAALLIACFKNESISHEIREVIGPKISVLEPLSCKCRDHVNKLQLVPPNSCCSSERSSPLSASGSEVSCSTLTSSNSYSYFSDQNRLDSYSEGEEGANAAAGRKLSLLVDVLDNIAARFKSSSSLTSNEEEVKIMYQNRDILDLGSNIRKGFDIKHPTTTDFVYNPLKGGYVKKKCSVVDCAFMDVIPFD